MSTLTFADTSHGWLLRQNNELARTADGGETWAATGYPGGAQIETVGFVDATHGYAKVWLPGEPVGCNLTSTAPRCAGALYRTVDGGTSWTRILTRREGIGGLTVLSADVIFAIAVAAGCTGYPDQCGTDLLRSADAGATWSNVTSDTRRILDVRFIDGRVGYAVLASGTGVGAVTVNMTTDGGASWSVGLELSHVRIPALEVSHGRVWVMSVPEAGCAMGGCAGYELWRSDGGTFRKITSDPLWYFHPAPGYPSFLSGPMFADAERGWIGAGAGAGASEGAVLHSDDGGSTWFRSSVTTPPPYSIGPIAALDGLTAIAIVANIGTPAFLTKTTDGARTWRRLAFAP